LPSAAIVDIEPYTFVAPLAFIVRLVTCCVDVIITSCPSAAVAAAGNNIVPAFNPPAGVSNNHCEFASAVIVRLNPSIGVFIVVTNVGLVKVD
jgi:hypothetical protein